MIPFFIHSAQYIQKDCIILKPDADYFSQISSSSYINGIICMLGSISSFFLNACQMNLLAEEFTPSRWVTTSRKRNCLALAHLKIIRYLQLSSLSLPRTTKEAKIVIEFALIVIRTKKPTFEVCAWIYVSQLYLIIIIAVGGHLVCIL